MLMNCDNNYCIYNKERKCRLTEVSVNELGRCDDCIIVSLEEDFLEAEKERQLAEIESRREDNSEE
jgi:hypothetical protein